MTKVMKNSLLALFWALAILPIAAQKPLPQSIQQHAAGLDPKVSLALKHVGFDLLPNASKQVNPIAQNRSGELRLDSTKTFFGYDFVGQVDTIPFLRTIHEYPQASVETQTAAQFENNAWLTVNRSTLFTDDQSRIVEVLSEAFDPVKGDFVPDSRAIAYPHEDSPVLIDSFYVYGWDTLAQDWALLFFTTNKFDGQDRLIESVSSFDYFGQPLLFKDVHTYDANGDNTLVETFAIFDGIELPSGKRELEYANHLPIESIAFVSDGLGGYMAQSRITYTYTSFDREEQVNSYEWDLDSNDWLQTQGDTYGYDNAQRVNSKETVFYNQDGSVERNLSRYSYVEDEKLALESNFVWDGIYFLSDRKFYYYSDATLSEEEPVRAAMPLVVSPNPTVDWARLSLTEPALVQIFDAKGEMLSRGEYQPNAALNFCDLPSGIYFVTARTANEQYVGRIIKD